MTGKKSDKKNPSKKVVKKPGGKNSRIKESGGVHWVLHKQHDVRKYKGFKNKGEAESFAATNPVEKGVKITATKAKPEQSEKKRKTPPVPNQKTPPKPGPKQPVGDKSGKVVSFNAGRAKYGKK